MQLNPATKPMALHAIAQPLVDDLIRLVIHIGGTFDVQADEVPAPLRDLYVRCMNAGV